MTVAASPVVPASSVPLIELDRACVIRGQVRVLHDLSLRIEQGQHTALLGPNGCGKSSFIKLITRELYPLAHGDGTVAVRVLGQNRWQVDRLRSQLGIVTGDLSSNLSDMPGLTVEEAVLTGFFASFVVPAFREVTPEMRERARETLAMTGALPLLQRGYAELSAGETRRVLIAREQLIATMRELARQGITLVLVTHHIEEIIPEIERVVMLRGGKILADGPRAELLRDGPLSELFGGPIHVVDQAGRLSAFAG